MTVPVDQIVDLVLYALGASGASAWLSTVFADKGKGGVAREVAMGVINKLGGNVGKAKNDADAQ